MKIHFIGCLGVSMRELMDLERAMQNTVSGSDTNLNGHRAENVHGADLVVYTCAVGEDNVELSEARRLGIPTVERATLLGQLAATHSTVIAVAGAHGKTTATGMSAAVLSEFSPTVHIGGELCPLGGRKDMPHRRGDLFLTEACEYRRSFLQLKPDIGAILNVDLDHTDYYKDLDDILSAFESFAARCGTVLVNSDDKACLYLGGGGRKYTFGFGPLAYFRAENLRQECDNSYTFDFKIGGVPAVRARSCQPGFHNIYNALCSLSLGVLAGLSPEEAARSLMRFRGVKRRFERVGELNGATVISDYAHHPKEIRATLANAAACARGKVYAVFQPHTYTRTQSLLGGFTDALGGADRAVIMPIFPAREKPLKGVSSIDIALGLQKQTSAVYIDTFCGVKDYLKERVCECDMVVFLGAGDIDRLARSYGAAL